MRTLGLLALAGAGLGFLLCTEKGKQLTHQATDRLKEGYEMIAEKVRSRVGVEGTIHHVLEQPHPDTAMASALEAAIG